MTEDPKSTPSPETSEAAGPAPEGGTTTAPAEDPVAVAQAEAARFKEQLLRTAADFDNFRKRARREQADAERKGRDDLLKDLLPVFDNLERAVQHGQAAGSSDQGDWKGLTDGIELVIRQFRDTLGRLGVERVEAVGLPFDPAVHEAIQHLETLDFAPGTVAHEVQSGYRQGERLIRPALVVVAKSPQEEVPQVADKDGSTDSASSTVN